VIKLYTSSDSFLMQSVKSELDALAIPYMVKNEYASGAVGELPWQEAQPELWLLDESWAAKANSVVDALTNSDSSKQRGWHCNQCDEQNGAAFDVCWQCSHPRPER